MTEETTVALYWSSSNQFANAFDANPSTPDLDPAYSIVAQSAVGTSLPIHVPRTLLGNSPLGTTHLLLVADPVSRTSPRGRVQESNEDNNLRSTRGFQVLVDPLRQYQPPWADDLYANSTTLTVSNKGCAVTALSMALNYAGVNQWFSPMAGQIVQNDPGTLDDLMATFGGYAGLAVDWDPATRLAAEVAGIAGIKFNARRTFSATSLDFYLRQGFPIIVGVDLGANGVPGHFVLVTGKAENAFTIIDPGHGQRTTLDAYNNIFETRGWVADPPDDISQFDVAIAPAEGTVDLTVIDQQGMVTGIDPATGVRLEQIANSVHFIDQLNDDVTGEADTSQAQLVHIFRPESSGYVIRTTAANNVPYTIIVHRYQPDGGSLATIRLEGIGSSDFFVPARNSSPDLDEIIDQQADEGSPLSFQVTATDQDSDQTLTYAIGAGPVGATIDPQSGLFTWTPTNGQVTEQVTVVVTDNGTPSLSDTETFTITVNNLPPLIDNIALASDSGEASEGRQIAASGAFTDPGVLDAHSAMIDWGDGTIAPGIVAEANGSGAVTGNHTYQRGGVYTVTLTVTDDDGDTATATTIVVVSGARLHGGVLQIVGTNDDDRVTVHRVGHNRLRVHADFLPERTKFRDFVTTGVTRIHVMLGGGDDQALIGGGVFVPVIIEGGTGNDLLYGGGGNNLLLGGDGYDLLTGGRGRNILIGGRGSDLLYGAGGEDVLVAGSTIYDSGDAGLAREEALLALLAEWSSGRDYATRVNNLNGIGSGERLNGDFFLNAETVEDDLAFDLLIGGSGLDWFLFTPGRDLVLGRKAGERVN